MRSFLRSGLVSAAILVSLACGRVLADDGKSSSVTPAEGAQSTSSAPGANPNSDLLGDALHHYRRGEYDAAIQNFSAMLQQNPRSPDAFVGLVHVYLRQKKIDLAYDEATKGVSTTDSPVIHVALGEVYFRQGLIPEAEREWLNVINGGYPSARAYLGLSRIRSAMSLYAQAKVMLDKAHELDPTDLDIQKRWINSQPRTEQIKFLEAYLASPTNDDPDARADLQHRLEYLKALEFEPSHPCQLVGHISSVEMPLVELLSDPHHVRGYGLPLLMNGRKGKVLLDTGASGIVVDEVLAKKSGVARISNVNVGGIGDQSRSGGYVGFADDIVVGDLDFHDCRVSVVERKSVVGYDGLLGGDFFARYHVDIDFPGKKLRLSPLPARPAEAPTPATASAPKENSNPDASPASPGAPSAPPPAGTVRRGPRDRYIAPEMASYTQVYRFSQSLLVPARVGDGPMRLFLIDTGSQSNTISLHAAQDVTKVHSDSHTQVHGLNGSVANVYSAEKVVIQFGHLRQEVQNLIAFDLSHLSDGLGTEVSGVLGFNTLDLLDLRIDYRDGIVDFTYAPGP